MTRDELRATLQADVTVSFAYAAQATGSGLTAARAACKRGTLPYRVIRVGRVLRVPSIDLERLLLTPADTAALGETESP